MFRGPAARLAADAVQTRAEQHWSPEPHASEASWLAEARQRLAQDSGKIADIARALGVHRVHFARAFRAATGLTPSAFRLRSMTARALSQILTHDIAFARAALDAGFADQAHFARAIRSLCGVSASQLRQMLTPAI